MKHGDQLTIYNHLLSRKDKYALINKYSQLVNHKYPTAIALLNILYVLSIKRQRTQQLRPFTAPTNIMTFTSEFITDGLPQPTFTCITGQPNRSNLMELHNNLCENAASVKSNLGGGNHGLLPIIGRAQYYLVQTGHAFIAPINPGNYTNIPSDAT